MKKLIALFLVIVIWAAIAAFKGDEVEVNCGVEVSTPQLTKGVDLGARVGDIVHDLADGKAPGFTDIWNLYWGTWKALAMVADAWHAHFMGAKESDQLEEWRRLSQEAQQRAKDSCCPTTTPPQQVEPEQPVPPPPFDPKSASLQQQGIKGYSPEQEKIAQTTISVGKALGVQERGWVVAIATGFGESGLHNLDYGDRDSLGVWQQRPSMGWGSRAQVRDVTYAASSFFKGAGGNAGLLDLKGWETMPVTVAAHKVQRNAYPNAYAKFEDDARRLVAAYGGVSAPAKKDTPNLKCESQSTSNGQTPKPGGGGSFPAAFNEQGNPRTVEQTMTFLQKMVDNRTPIEPRYCSRYVARAYGWPNSGIHTALLMWQTMPSDLKHPGRSDPPRGALVFWKTSEEPGHIAISAGRRMVYTTDVPKGRWGLVSIDKIDRWGPRQGWSSPYYSAHAKKDAA